MLWGFCLKLPEEKGKLPSNLRAPGLGLLGKSLKTTYFCDSGNRIFEEHRSR